MIVIDLISKKNILFNQNKIFLFLILSIPKTSYILSIFFISKIPPYSIFLIPFESISNNLTNKMSSEDLKNACRLGDL